MRGVGLIRSMDDIRNTMLTQSNGTPVLVQRRRHRHGRLPAAARHRRPGRRRRHRPGHRADAPRRAEHADDRSASSRRSRRSTRPNILPPGVRIERIYDRKDLIDITTHTVLHNMVFGIVADLPAAVAVPRQSAQRAHRRRDHPVRAVLRGRHPGAARRIGEPAVGRRDRLRPDRRRHRDHGREHLPPSRRSRDELATARRCRPAAGGLRGKLCAIFHAATEVNRAIFFAAAIIIAGFLPLFTLSGVEGHIFGPMAKTYAYALAGGLLATFTVSPALERAAPAGAGARDRDAGSCACLHRLYSAGPAASPSPTASLIAWRRRAVARAGGGRRAARSASNSCPSSRKATSGSAPPCRPRSRSRRATATSTACAPLIAQLPRSRDRSSRSTAGPTTAPTRPASSMPSSSRR